MNEEDNERGGEERRGEKSREEERRGERRREWESESGVQSLRGEMTTDKRGERGK